MKGTLTIDGVTVEIKLTEEQVKQVKEAMEPKRWRALMGESYYFVDLLGQVLKHFDTGTQTNHQNYIQGNYFPSEEQAKMYKRRLESMLEMEPLPHPMKTEIDGVLQYTMMVSMPIKYKEAWETPLYDPTLFTDKS